MSKIIQFKNNQPEQCECDPCQLAREYVEYCKLADSEEELFDILRELISDASDLELQNYLQQEIVAKGQLLDHLVYGCCDGECDCGDED